MFANYPDVVEVKDLLQMLNISRSTASTLLKNKTINNFKIGRVYKIPKKCIVDYINSNLI